MKLKKGGVWVVDGMGLKQNSVAKGRRAEQPPLMEGMCEKLPLRALLLKPVGVGGTSSFNVGIIILSPSPFCPFCNLTNQETKKKHCTKEEFFFCHFDAQII